MMNKPIKYTMIYSGDMNNVLGPIYKSITMPCPPWDTPDAPESAEERRQRLMKRRHGLDYTDRRRELRAQRKQEAS